MIIVPEANRRRFLLLPVCNFFLRGDLMIFQVFEMSLCSNDEMVEERIFRIGHSEFDNALEMVELDLEC